MVAEMYWKDRDAGGLGSWRREVVLRERADVVCGESGFVGGRLSICRGAECVHRSFDGEGWEAEAGGWGNVRVDPVAGLAEEGRGRGWGRLNKSRICKISGSWFQGDECFDATVHNRGLEACNDACDILL